MIDYITTTLQEVASQPIGLVFALLLGTASAATSACCALPALGILVGYSGSRTTNDRKSVLKTVATFVLGSVLSMMIIGGVAGFIGQVAQSTLGHYWKIFAGIVAIFLGLATLKLLPFSLSFIKLNEKSSKLGESESVLAGILLGGILFYMLIIKNKIIGIIMKDTKKKKGILAAIWDSMTKTGGCCGPGDSCGCSATSEKSKKTSKK